METAHPRLFEKALQRALGPLDAEHLAHVIIISTSEEPDPDLEIMEHECLLFLIINEIRNTDAENRSFAKIEQSLSPENPGSLEGVLKHTDSWQKAKSRGELELLVACIKERLQVVVRENNPQL
ncbi:MAG: hypothetical protein K2X27_10645 [Candidatus Obscuribacterales bacterium]|nr:hypothetical protein [Candidatus Obscuribacterales bacterium]